MNLTTNQTLLLLGGVLFLIVLAIVIAAITYNRRHANTMSMVASSEDPPKINSLQIYLTDLFKEVISTELYLNHGTYVIADEFTSKLQKEFGRNYELVSLTESVKDGKVSQGYETQIVKLTRNKEYIILEIVKTPGFLTTDKKGAPTALNKAGTYVDESLYYDTVRYHGVGSVKVHHSTSTKFKYQMVQDILTRKWDKGGVARDIPKKTPIPYTDPETEAEVSVITYDTMKGFSKKPSKLRVYDMSNAELDLNYAPIQMEFMDKTIPVPMSKLMPYIPKAAAHKENVYVLGPPGTGKTIVSQTALYVTKEELASKVRVFIIATSLVPHLLNPEFEDNASKIFEKEFINFIFIDEAQRLFKASDSGESMSPLLELLSGSTRERYNLTFILVINGKRADLDKALFRAGRAGMIMTLTVLPEAQARAKFAALKKEVNPKEYFMDEKLFEKILNTPNKFVEENPLEEPYALPGEMLLADIYRCKIPVEKNNMFNDLMTNLVLETKPVKKLGKIA